MGSRRNVLCSAAAAMVGAVAFATVAGAQSYGDMMKGMGKDAAQDQINGAAKQAVGGGNAPAADGSGAAPADGSGAAAGGAAAPMDTMGRVNSAAGAGATGAAAGAMGGDMKGAAMGGGKAAMDDWK